MAKASSVKSKLFSPSDIQSIMKKAMVERLKSKYRIQWFQEDGASYPLRVFLMKDIVTVGIDTSGDSLHKRGYRPAAGKAPISETLAAALIMLTPWRKDRILVDPFLRKWYLSNRGCNDGCKDCPGNEPVFYRRDMD